jgi:hypothetical protein
VGSYRSFTEALGVAVSGNYASIAGGGDAGLEVINVSNPASPQWVALYDTSGRALDVAVSGNFAYVADDSAGLQVIDVSNPANPQRVGEIRLFSPTISSWLATKCSSPQATTAS